MQERKQGEVIHFSLVRAPKEREVEGEDAEFDLADAIRVSPDGGSLIFSVDRPMTVEIPVERAVRLGVMLIQVAGMIGAMSEAQESP